MLRTRCAASMAITPTCIDWSTDSCSLRGVVSRSTCCPAITDLIERLRDAANLPDSRVGNRRGLALIDERAGTARLPRDVSRSAREDRSSDAIRGRQPELLPQRNRDAAPTPARRIAPPPTALTGMRTSKRGSSRAGGCVGYPCANTTAWRASRAGSRDRALSGLAIPLFRSRYPAPGPSR